MRRTLALLFIAPLLLAFQCEDDYVCGYTEPEPYSLSIENPQISYSSNETIWLNAQTSSMLMDECDETSDPEVVTDATLFLDGLFLLKLDNDLLGLNATVVEDANISYAVGELFENGDCINSIDCRPELTDDLLFYQYRLGIAISVPGDYCIVNARNSNFDVDTENNIELFEAYNSLDNKIKFADCDLTFTRDISSNYFFFRVDF